jgi:capsular polysaccharide biosynthesis protein
VPHPEQNPVVHRSAQIYGRLLLLYPNRFRQLYGKPMMQLFRDQCQEAFDDEAAYGLAKLWGRVLADLSFTTCREHLTELTNLMSTPAMKSFLGRPRLTFTKVFAVTFLLLAAILAMSVVFWMPRSYSSLARIAVEKKEGSAGGYDPYFLQTEFARLQSRAVLDPVIDELDLTKRLARQGGSGSLLTKTEAYAILKGMVDLRQTRNTSLLEVRVYDKDRHVAAAIANRIVEAYRRSVETSTAPILVQLIDQAEPGLRPTRPNVPMTLALGSALSLLVAAALATVARLLASKYTACPESPA